MSSPLQFPLYIFESFDELFKNSKEYANFPSMLKRLKNLYDKFNSSKYDDIIFKNHTQITDELKDLTHTYKEKGKKIIKNSVSIVKSNFY